jgi:hypothetical protein
VLLLFVLCGLTLAQEEQPPILTIVYADDGKILGEVQGDYGTSRSGRQYERYRGIRYGQSPYKTGRRFLVISFLLCYPKRKKNPKRQVSYTRKTSEKHARILWLHKNP